MPVNLQMYPESATARQHHHQRTTPPSISCQVPRRLCACCPLVVSHHAPSEPDKLNSETRPQPNLKLNANQASMMRPSRQRQRHPH